MQELNIELPLVYHGTLAADATFRWKAPFDCILWHVSAVAGNNSDATLKLGTNSADDGIMTATAIGARGAPAEFTASNWAATNPTGRINKGAVFLATLDFDGASGTAAQDVSLVFTFRVGRRGKNSPCQNCGHKQSHARHRCARCYAYLRRYGVERPPHLLLRDKLASQPKSGCLNCGSPESHAHQRCRYCYNYLKRQRTERPLKKVRRCACGRDNVARIIYAKILTGDQSTPLKVAIPVCNACYQLEHA